MGQGIEERLLLSLRRAEELFRWRYLGVGLIWAWIYCAYATPALFAQREGHSINADGSWLVSAMAVVAAFFVLSLLLRKCRTAPRVGWVLLASGALAVGTVLSAVGGETGGVPLWAGGILTGFGYAGLSVLWAMAFAPLDVEELELAIPLSSLVVIPCVIVFPSLGGVSGVIATALIPLVSGLLLLLSLEKDGAESEGEDATTTVPPADEGRAAMIPPAGEGRAAWVVYFVRTGIVLVLLYVAVGWESSLVPVQDGAQSVLGLDISSLLSNGSTIALAVLFVLFSPKVGFGSMFRWVIPLMIVSVAVFVQPGGSADFVASVVCATCDTLAQVLVFLFAVALAKGRYGSAALALGVANGLLQLGVLLGNLLGSLCRQGFLGADPGIFACVLICLLAAATLVVPLREPDAGAAPGPSEAMESSGLARACRKLQQRFGLSEREVEVMELLAEGRARPYIRERLFISNNTVATHVKHIYAKLDVHSKEELIDLVRSVEPRSW